VVNLSDPAAQEALYHSAAMHSFACIDLGRELASDETTVCKFRHLLEKHKLGEAVQSGESASARAGHLGEPWHDRGRYDHQCALFDEEQKWRARSRRFGIVAWRKTSTVCG